MTKLSSTVCRYEHFQTEWYRNLALRFLFDRPDYSINDPRQNLHRKLWEHCAISQVLFQHNMLCEGRSGLGFAVGKEPLPSLFASHGVDILATDLMTGDQTKSWEATGQHASSLDDLYKSYLVEKTKFDEHVTFQFADMCNLAEFERNSVDFLWSSCAFEHLGTLQKGIDFVCEAMDLVKPGGIAVHTTEYNISSNTDTMVEGPEAIYRRCDIEDLDRRLRLKSCGIDPIDFNPGIHPYDLDYDRYPCYTTGRKHIKVMIHGYVCTSILLIIHKGA